MKDLTKGSIWVHLAALATSFFSSMLAPIAYQLVNLYFVAELGAAAIAGVNATGNIMLVVLALNQVLAVGTVALSAHASGRKDLIASSWILNQAILLATCSGIMAIVLIYVTIRPYLRLIAADIGTIDEGTNFAVWALPGYALTLPFTVLGSALRGAGIVAPTVIFQALVVMINIVLAPVTIAGWGTGVALGVRGAGLATGISVLVGLVMFLLHCHYAYSWMRIQWNFMKPNSDYWARILRVGFPAGADFLTFFVYTAAVYYVIRDFGAAAQAGFGIGARLMQMIALPGIALGLAVGPVAGQNFGIMNSQRVREALRKATLGATAAMSVAIVVVQIQSNLVLSMFQADTATISAANQFLQITSWGLLAQGLVAICSSMFQAFGNTMPTLISSVMRILAFALSAGWLCAQPRFRVEEVWYISVASLVLQSAVSLWWIRMEFRTRFPKYSGGAV